MIVCTAASPSIDKLFVVERLERGAVHRPREFLQLPGGKAINVARAVTALGGGATVVGFAGGHTGRWLAERVAAEGITGRFLHADAEARASLSVFDRARGSLTEFYETGEPISVSEWCSLSREVLAALEPGDWLAIAGSLPPGAPEDGYAELVSQAHESGARAAIDARGPALATALEAHPEVVKVNAAEAGETLGVEVADLEAALATAAALRDRAANEQGIAIVTCGEVGAALATRQQGVYVGRLASRGPYPVGSGDAFLAGLLLGRERGVWCDAFVLAMAAGAANAERPGPGRLDARRARELVAMVEIVHKSDCD
jgi:1-phosphofructokinase family hexose kinase